LLLYLGLLAAKVSGSSGISPQRKKSPSRNVAWRIIILEEAPYLD
jgi:hypothetical protein